jgi:hypothetical protein
MPERHDDAAGPRARPQAEEPLLRIAARRAARKVRAEAATPEFGRLLFFQASGAAGDALLALALAGSLFFSVPEATARGRVALYLLLTVAPFAVVAPLLSSFLDRHGGGTKLAMVVAALGRGTLAWWLASRLDSLYLFPIAFFVLVLSRAALVVKGALLPEIAPPGRTLVRANASLSKASAAAGIVAVPVGLVVQHLSGSNAELLLTAFVYCIGAIPALRLPVPRGRRDLHERVKARALARSVGVRQASFCAVGMRLLVGFLVLHLAFSLRREDIGDVGLGVLIASAATGALVGSLLAPLLRRWLREEGILVVSLIAAGLAAIVVGQSFTLIGAALLVGVFGVASGASKVAFDAIVQGDTPPAARGWAFARFEAVMQIAWVVGALIPLGPVIPTGSGIVAAGIVANALALVYLAGRLHVRAGNSRDRDL